MCNEEIRVLLIEDTPGDIHLIRSMLEGLPGVNFLIEAQEDLSGGLTSFSEGTFDVVLLDLGLPDSQGLDTLIQAYSHISTVPIVVLTGRADEDLGDEAVKEGAQDYLAKGDIDGRLLLRSIRYSIERHRLHEQLQEKLEEERRRHEHKSFEEIARFSRPSAIARAYGKIPLHESSPSKFAELVGRYERLLELALDQKEFQVEHHVSRDLRNVAEEIGHEGCMPLDVIEIHAAALDRKSKNVSGKRLRAFEEEGRLLVLQLMGFLASFYRRYFVRQP